MALLRPSGELIWQIPSDINLPEILNEHPPRGFKPILDHFYFVLDYVGRQMEFQDLDETNGFVSLNAQKLQSYIDKYRLYLNYLLDWNILQTDNLFIRGKKSRGYAIRERYVAGETVEIPVERFALRKRLKRELKRQAERHSRFATEYSYLTRWFNKGLQIDEKAAMAKIEELYPPLPTTGFRGSMKGYNRRSKKYKAQQAVQKLRDRDFYFSVDDTIGRFHSNLTNLKRDLRPFLRYEGQKLVNVDIANAQPLFGAVLLKEEFWTGKRGLSIRNIKSVNRQYKSKSQYSKTIQDILSYITLGKSAESKDGLEFEQYSESVQNGTFYRSAFEKMFPGQPFKKERIKLAIFQTLFSDNRFIGQEAAIPKKNFALAYPNVYRVFKRLKRGNSVVLSHLLQRIESHIMVETVAQRIAQERPELSFFTIHDSLLVPGGNEDYAAKVIKEEIYRLTGLNCAVSVES